MTWEYRTDDVRVCWAHGRVNVCRVGLYRHVDSCDWRDDAASINAVTDYQLNARRDWRS